MTCASDAPSQLFGYKTTSGSVWRGTTTGLVDGDAQQKVKPCSKSQYSDLQNVFLDFFFFDCPVWRVVAGQVHIFLDQPMPIPYLFPRVKWIFTSSSTFDINRQSVALLRKMFSETAKTLVGGVPCLSFHPPRHARSLVHFTCINTSPRAPHFTTNSTQP